MARKEKVIIRIKMNKVPETTFVNELKAFAKRVADQL